jgi:cytochrome c oxidase subunit 2
MARTRYWTALSLAIALCATATGVAGADSERGEALYDLCAQCHGSQGQGNALFLAPAIAGLDKWYIETQLKKFRTGLRGTHFDDIAGMRMRPMSLTLRSEEDVVAVATYAASLPDYKPERTVEGSVEAGKSLYVICAACHGQNGEGVQAMSSPSLNRTSDWYLVSQLNKFKAGIRGTNPKDPISFLMGPQSPMAMTLKTEQSVRDVVAYITTLKP